MRKIHPREAIERLAYTVQTIDAQQPDHPGYLLDMAKSIVNAELKLLAAESERYWSATTP